MSKKKAAPTNVRPYAWRPDFRDLDSLPDIRKVRTRLFAPITCITLALVMGGLLVTREYNAMVLGKNIDQLSEEIDGFKERHREIQKRNGDFLKVSKNVDEIVDFTKDQLVASDFLIDLAQVVPTDIHLTKVSYNEMGASIEGVVTKSAEEASKIVNDFLTAMEESDVLQGKLDEYKLTSLDRGKESGSVDFTIEVIESSKK